MFCGNCGAELKEGASFCYNCGEKVDNQINNSAFNSNQNEVQCLYCGNFIPAGLDQCPYCRNYINPSLNKDYTWVIVLGYILSFSVILSFLLSLGGIICGIYLVTRDNEEVHTHGIILIILPIVMVLICFIAIFVLF